MIVAAVFSLILGLSFLIGKKDNRSTGVFFFFLGFGVALWSIFHSIFDILPLENKFYWTVARMLYVGATFIPMSLFHFAISLRTTGVAKSRAYKIGRYFSLAYFIGLNVLIFVPNVILSGTAIHNNVRQVVFGNFHVIYIFYIILFFLIAFYHLIKYLLESKGSTRTQASFILAGTASAAVVATTSNLILPFMGIFDFFWIGPTISILMVFVIEYAVMKHNLLNFKSIIAQAYTYLIPVIALFGLFFVTSFMGLIFMLILLIVLTILSILLLKQISNEIEYREKGERLARYLANANARLRELDKQKTEFVSIASHQLRSPIASIKGYASLIFDGTYGTVPEKIKEPMGRILESAQRIGIIVDDFLNVTRIEQGRMSYSMTPQSICKLLNSVVSELQVVANDKGLVLSVMCNGNEILQVKGDEGKLKQIFSNLIDNAIKYTQHGSITVSVEKNEAEDKVFVRIKDTGIGIAPEEVSSLFQKFNRASNANKTNVLGTGLGLYIARQILKAHDGLVDVQSEGIGKGSTFTVELPVYEKSRDEKK